MSSIVNIGRLSSVITEYIRTQQGSGAIEAINNKEALFNFLKSKGYVFADCKDQCEEYQRLGGQSCCKHYDPELSKCFLLDDREG